MSLFPVKALHVSILSRIIAFRYSRSNSIAYPTRVFIYTFREVTTRHRFSASRDNNRISAPLNRIKRGIDIPRLIITDIFAVAFKLLKRRVRLHTSVRFQKELCAIRFQGSHQECCLIIYPSARLLFYPHCLGRSPPPSPTTTIASRCRASSTRRRFFLFIFLLLPCANGHTTRGEM